MNFQLFKIAQDNTIKLPRIVEFCRVLMDVVAPSYASTEPEHPELEQLALLLSRKFANMDSDIPVFDSIYSIDPAKNFNSDLLQFKVSELRGMASDIENPSVELGDENMKALLNIVLQAAIFVCWQDFSIKNPSVLILGAARGLSEHRMLKLAAPVDDVPKYGTGRRAIRVDRGAIDLENPLTSQGLLEHALISYNAAFNALVVSSAVPLFAKPNQRGQRSAGDVLRSHSLLQMVDNLDILDTYSQYAAKHKEAYDSGIRSLLDGTVLLPDPVYGPAIGGDHLRWSREGAMQKAAPNAICSSASIGQSEEVRSKAKQQEINLREMVYERSMEESGVWGTAHSAVGAHGRAVSAYKKDMLEIKKPIEKYLVKGFLHHIYSVRVNGLDMSRWSLHIPALSDNSLRQRLKASLGAVIAGIPADIDSLSAAAEICDKLVKAEAGKFSEYDPLLNNLLINENARKMSDSFFGYVAQLYLHLPIHFVSEWTNFDFREALVPIPDIITDQNIELGTEDHSFENVASLVLGATPDADISIKDAIYTKLNNLKNAVNSPNTGNLLILARRASLGQIPVSQFSEKLREFTDKMVSLSSGFVKNIRVFSEDDKGNKKEKGAATRLRDALSIVEKNIKENPSQADSLLKRKTMLQQRLKACEDIEEYISQSGLMNFVEPFVKKAVLSICSNPNDDQVIAAAGSFIAGTHTEQDEVKLASAISGSFPGGKFNIDSPSQEHSNYNSFSKIRDMGLDQDDEFHVYENSSAVVPTDPGKARYSVMYCSTQHFIVDQLKREHNTRTYSQNKIELEKIIKSEYPKNPEDAGISLREMDIESKISELIAAKGKNNILAKLGLEELMSATIKVETKDGFEDTPLVAAGVDFNTLLQGRRDKMSSEHAEALKRVKPARVAFLKKLQEFFYNNTKSSIIQVLRSTPRPSAKPVGGVKQPSEKTRENFDESYYDALMTLVARRCAFPFQHDITFLLFHRFGDKNFGPASVAGGEDVPEKEISENVLTGDAVRSRKFKMDSVSIAKYAEEWMFRPRFRKDGKKALHPYSLPGFFAEILAKKDIMERKDVSDEEKRDIQKFLQIVFADPGESKNFYHIPIFGLMKFRAACSLGKEMYDKAGSQIGAVLRQAAASGDPELPKTRPELVARLTLKLGRGFTNPIAAIKRLASGEAKAESHGLAFDRLRSSMGDIEKGNYLSWEKEVLRELAILIDRNEFEIQRHPMLSIEDKKYLLELARSSKLENAADIEKEAYSAEDIERLRSLAVKFSKPAQKASTIDLYNVLESAQFADILNGPEFSFIPKARAKDTLTKERITAAKKAIKTSRSYVYAFEYELNLGKSPAEALKSVLLNLRGPALGSDESGKPFDINSDYAKQAISYSKIALEQAARQGAFDEFLQEWIKESKINTTPASLKEEMLDNKDLVVRFEQILSEEFGPDYQATVTSIEEMRSLVDILIRAWEDVQGSKEQLRATVSNSAAMLDSFDETEKGGAAVDAAAASEAKAMAAHISDVCEANTEMRVFMTGLLQPDELELKINLSDASVVRQLADRIKAMPLSAPELKPIQEGIIDSLIAKPASISSQRYRDMVEAGDTGRNVRVGLRQQASDILKRQLSSAGTNFDMIADRLENTKNAAPAIKAPVAMSSTAISADGGASALIADGKAIMNANIFYSNISVSTSKFYSVFADNLERKIKEWVPRAVSDFPNLIEIGDLVLASVGLPKTGAAIEALSKLPLSEIYRLNGGRELYTWQVDIIVTYLDSKVKEAKIAEIRADIAKIPVAAMHELQAWRQATATKEEDLDKLRPSSFPLTLSQNADLVSEEAQRLTPDNDNDASITSDERKAREQSLAQVSVQIKDLRRALDLARGVADAVRTQGKRLIDLFEKEMLSDNSIVNIVDQAALDAVATSIKDAVSVVRSAKKEKLSSESNSVFADLLMAVNSVIGKDNEIIPEPPRADVAPAAAKAIQMDASAIDKELKNINEFVIASRGYIDDPEGLDVISRLSQLVDILAEGRRKVQPGANIVGVTEHLRALYNILMRGGVPKPEYMANMLANIHSAGVLTDEFKEDKLEIVDSEDAAVVDIMAGFDAQIDSITRILASKTSHLSPDVKSALVAAIDALSPSNRKVAPDADIRNAVHDLKALYDALDKKVDLRPEQIEVMMSGLRARGIDTNKVLLVEPQAVQQPAPIVGDKGEVVEIDESGAILYPPTAEPGKIAPDEDLQLFDPNAPEVKLDADESEQLFDPNAPEMDIFEPPQAPVAVPHASSELYTNLHDLVLNSADAAKKSGATGFTVEKLISLEQKLGRMPSPAVDLDASVVAMNSAIVSAHNVFNMISTSTKAPTWKPGSELPHMPELDKLIVEVDQILSPTRRASRSIRFVRTGDSWLI